MAFQPTGSMSLFLYGSAQRGQELHWSAGCSRALLAAGASNKSPPASSELANALLIQQHQQEAKLLAALAAAEAATSNTDESNKQQPIHDNQQIKQHQQNHHHHQAAAHHRLPLFGREMDDAEGEELVTNYDEEDGRQEAGDSEGDIADDLDALEEFGEEAEQETALNLSLHNNHNDNDAHNTTTTTNDESNRTQEHDSNNKIAYRNAQVRATQKSSFITHQQEQQHPVLGALALALRAPLAHDSQLNSSSKRQQQPVAHLQSSALAGNSLSYNSSGSSTSSSSSSHSSHSSASSSSGWSSAADSLASCSPERQADSGASPLTPTTTTTIAHHHHHHNDHHHHQAQQQQPHNQHGVAPDLQHLNHHLTLAVASQHRPLFLRHHAHHHHHHHELGPVHKADSDDLDRIRNFIEQFKARRGALGLTQKQAAQCFRAYTNDRYAFSDNFVGHFEGFQFRPQTAMTIADSLAEWLEFAENETRQGRQLAFMPGKVKETRKRKYEVIRIRDSAKRVLVEAFEKNKSPSTSELEQLSRKTNIPSRNIEIFFKNRRTSRQYHQ